MPPTFRMEIDTPGEFLTLIVFALSGGVICLIAFAKDRGRRELRIAESQRQQQRTMAANRTTLHPVLDVGDRS